MPPKVDLLQVVASNIKAYRKLHNLSQEEFSARVGLHRTYIGAIERCERNLTLGTLSLIAETMNVLPWQLLIAAQKPESRQGKTVVGKTRLK